jgi:hypothetical protein
LIDDTLEVAAALADVLDEVDVVMAVDALDANEHGAGLPTRGRAPSALENSS